MPSERMQRQIDSLLDEAEAGVRALEWQTVRDRCEAVLRLDPGNEDAQALLAAAGSDIMGRISEFIPVSIPTKRTLPFSLHCVTFASNTPLSATK
jgi:hypothetical protein